MPPARVLGSLLAHELGEDAVDMRAAPVQLVAVGAAQDDLLAGADALRQAISNHGLVGRLEARVAARAARELARGIFSAALISLILDAVGARQVPRSW